MARFEALDHGIVCIDSGYVDNEYAAIYLIQQGDEVAIIETGTFRTIPHVLAVLSELGIKHSQIKYVIPTHIHLDHAGGASGMMALFKQARLIIHPRGARHMIDPSRLIAGSKVVYGKEAFNRLYGEIKAINEQRVDIADDLDVYAIGDRELVFIDTPGHAKHHFCIYDAQSKGIFTGDTFGLSYPPLKNRAHGLIPTSSPVDFNPEAMLMSVDRLLDYQPERMYLTHFGEIDTPQNKIADFKLWISDYLTLCERIKPADETSTKELEQALRQMTVEKLGATAGCSEKELLALMSSDIRLNAQGLAIWWQARNNA